MGDSLKGLHGRQTLLTALFLGATSLGAACPAAADTLYLQGRMAGRLTLEIVERYDPAPGTRWITIDSFRAPSFGSAIWRQRVVSENVTYSILTAEATPSQDAGGNTVLRERWNRPSGSIRIVRTLVVDSEATLAPLESRAPFPLGAVPGAARRFLAATPLTQVEDPKIAATARRLTATARSEREAVSAILNFVVDHLRYRYDPPAHDAVFALERRSGNCQGYSHLSLALLRAAGIPARLTAGVSLSKGWRVQHDDGTVTFRMGQGRHGWIEVFYPDLGWMPYDPQTSHLFVSIYHVRHAIGRDATEAQSVITASPVLPAMQETIDANTADESFAVRTISTAKVPRNYIVAGQASDLMVVATLPPSPPAPAATPPAPPVMPTPATPPSLAVTPPSPSRALSPVPPPPLAVTPLPVPPMATPPPPALAPAPAPAPVQRHQLTRVVELGNMEFPAALRIFGVPEPAAQPGAMRARRTYVVETADYATGAEELAQAFTLTEALLLSQVSLALQKFGGQTGEIWIDVLDDRGRRPASRLLESRRLPVGALIDRGGYRWVVFDVPEMLLTPGRYWMVLRSSGDGIFNWYFSLGNAYGDPDDSRSTRRGVTDWSNVLNYRFNFRLSGMARP